MTAIRQQTRAPAHPKLRPSRVQIAADVDPSQHSAGAAEATTSQVCDSRAERLAYSVAEAAFITGLSRDLLYDQMRTGNLAYLKVGRRRIITRQQIEAFLASDAS